MATHSSILAWRIPWSEEPGRLQSTGSQRVGHDWVTSLHFTHYDPITIFFIVLGLLFVSLSLLLCFLPREVPLAFAVKLVSVQFSHSIVNCSMPGLPVHHQLPEFTQTHIHRVNDAIQPPHPLSSPFPTAPNPSQHQSLFQWVKSSHEVAKVLEFQL